MGVCFGGTLVSAATVKTFTQEEGGLLVQGADGRAPFRIRCIHTHVAVEQFLMMLKVEQCRIYVPFCQCDSHFSLCCILDHQVLTAHFALCDNSKCENSPCCVNIAMKVEHSLLRVSVLSQQVRPLTWALAGATTCTQPLLWSLPGSGALS